VIPPSSHNRCRFCGFLLLLALWASLFASDVKPLILLPYDQSRIYFADFFDIESIPSPELSEKLQTIVFGFAPLPGKTLVFQSDYLRAKIALYFPEIEPIIRSETITVSRGLTPTSSSWGAAPPLTGATETVDIPSETFLSPNEWKSRLETLTLAFLSETWSVAIPPEAFHLELSIEPPTVFSDRPWDLTFTKFGKSEYFVKIVADSPVNSPATRWTGKVKPIWIRNLATAGRNIRYKESFSSDAVVFKPLNYFDYRDPVVEGVSFPKVAKAFIKSGAVIEGTMIANPPYVKAGQVIFAVVRIGGVEVKGLVEALKDAQIGEVIQARNVETGALLTGIVEEGPVLRLH